MSSTSAVVLITGCGSGIGQALARAFHARGQRVCATARRLDTLAPLQAEGLMTRALDVTDPQALQALTWAYCMLPCALKALAAWSM